MNLWIKSLMTLRQMIKIIVAVLIWAVMLSNCSAQFSKTNFLHAWFAPL